MPYSTDHTSDVVVCHVAASPRHKEQQIYGSTPQIATTDDDRNSNKQPTQRLRKHRINYHFSH